MNATDVAAALARNAEAACRKYLPNGRRRGRYWIAGDARGARGRSLFLRLAPPGPVGKWTDATGEHGDLLDIVRVAIGATALRPALDEARAFLALPRASRADRWGDYAATAGGPSLPSPPRPHSAVPSARSPSSVRREERTPPTPPPVPLRAGVL